MNISRRGFVSGCGVAFGSLRFRTDLDAWIQAPTGTATTRRARPSAEEYDKLIKLASNENSYGPSESVMKAMVDGLKYAGRYGAPDGGLVEAIASHHGVKSENILIGAGSSEILDVVSTTFLEGGRKVIGVEPSYSSVYQHATAVKGDAIKLPLETGYRQNMERIIAAAKTHYREVGFVYICNPNNPTGVTVTRTEIQQLLDGLPPDVPVLIDEAYHHFVDDPAYATSVPHVLAGRPVIVTRTFSKIAALAGMRLGYGIAPKELIDRMRPQGIGSINVAVRLAGVAALQDTETITKVRTAVIATRRKVSADLMAYGYSVIPSQANFFMVDIGRDVLPVIQEFRTRGVLVGRPFPPMTQHLRVSIGTDPEMARFLEVFKEVFPDGKTTAGSGRPQ
jgi:histidinol-phosphate aminotransferase